MKTKKTDAVLALVTLVVVMWAAGYQYQIGKDTVGNALTVMAVILASGALLAMRDGSND